MQEGKRRRTIAVQKVDFRGRVLGDGFERFRTEQQQLVASAEAERQAAEQEAQQRRLLADAQAYEIEALNKAIANNPAYLQLQALEALKAISENPSSKIYFLNSDSPSPLPLLHIGDVLK